MKLIGTTPIVGKKFKLVIDLPNGIDIYLSNCKRYYRCTMHGNDIYWLSNSVEWIEHTPIRCAAVKRVQKKTGRLFNPQIIY